MSFRFEADYLQDLEPVLAHLKEMALSGTLSEIETCRASGSMGGEILDCICASLRDALSIRLSPAAEEAVQEYLKRAGSR